MTKKGLTAAQATRETFGNKWQTWENLLFDEVGAREAGILDWIFRRNGWSNTASLKDFLEDKREILDAGCGNGRITALLSNSASKDAKISGWDVNESVARKNLRNDRKIKVEHVDLSGDSFPDTEFDFIYCQEVLHHLPDPKKSFERLTERLRPGGVIAVYLYGLKHPFREFSDEWVREVFQSLPHESQVLLSQNITRLGKQLSSIKEILSIEGLEPLGLASGQYPVQKFFYDFFFKCFWNSCMGESSSTAVNFDWFGPALASKHSLIEIESWCQDLGLKVVHSLQDEYGVTVHGQKK